LTFGQCLILILKKGGTLTPSENFNAESDSDFLCSAERLEKIFISPPKIKSAMYRFYNVVI